MICFAILCIIYLSSIAQGQDSTIVQTNNGDLEGDIFKDRKGNDFYAFLSVPYAKPPLGDLRFKAPQPVEKWEGIRDATQELSLCSQHRPESSEPIGIEDCLYLNVYTPKINASDFMPVMFLIHGGKFWFGSTGLTKHGPDYLMPKQVVMVAIHYRVGALGFISLDHKSTEVSANNGLKDQVMALKWVQENIKQFGGDPQKVTIIGESAGSSSVHYLLLSPLSEGLFHRAILESGTATPHWANGATNSAKLIAEQLKINTDNESEMIKELKRVPASDLVQAQIQVFFQTKETEIAFGAPIIEGPGEDSFVVDHPRNIVDSGNFVKVS